jgi:hypothetical protein
MDENWPTVETEMDDRPSTNSITILEDPPFQSSQSTTQEMNVDDDDLSSGSEIDIDDAVSSDSRIHISNGERSLFIPVQISSTSLADTQRFEVDEWNEFDQYPRISRW